jgi:hypothetical protein
LLDSRASHFYNRIMPRSKKGELERIADMILLDDAVRKGYVKGTGNKHGFGAYMREGGMLNAALESEIAAHEKTGFDEGQLEDLIHEGGPDRKTRERYRKVE